jgi:uncharacterized protein (DUF736 family)
MKKIRKILEKKAKNAVLTAALAGVTLGGVTSCGENKGRGYTTDGTPIEKFMKDTEEQHKKDSIQQQKEAQIELKKIEKSGIAIVKKDKEGNITKVLSRVDKVRSDKLKGNEVVSSYTYSKPQYMTVHKKAYTERRSGASWILESDSGKEYIRREIHHPAIDYETTPTSMSVASVGGTPYTRVEISGDTVVSSVAPNGDTIMHIQTKEVDLHKNFVLRYTFNYAKKEQAKTKTQETEQLKYTFDAPKKEQTKAKTQQKGQPMARRGGRNS